MGTPPAAAAEMRSQQFNPQPTLAVSLTRAPSGAPNTAGLVTRGDSFASAGDITSARLFYERAAEAGDGRAALRIAMTFDPVVLGQIGIRAMAGDSREAFFWYQRARDLGQPTAELLLKEINRLLSRPNESNESNESREGARAAGRKN
jgi:TPR repeat protein